MSEGAQSPAKRQNTLSRSEWAFEGVAKGEVEACMWWEYLRTGLDVSLRTDLEARYREVCVYFDDEGVLDFRDAICQRSFIQERFIWPGVLTGFTCAEHPLRQIDGEWKRTADFFFERCPWLDLPEDYREKLVSGFGFSAFPLLMQPLPFEANKEGVYDESQQEGIRVISFRQRVLASDCNAVFSVRLDWRFLDDEIVAEFRRMLRRFAPADRMTPKHRYYGSVSRDVFPSPASQRGALKALGVFRRWKSAGGWQEYFATYPAENGSSEPDESDLNKTAERAIDIIAWMKDGDANHLKQIFAARERARKSRKQSGQETFG